MLTPIEIQSRVFKSVGLGYDKKDVDSFIKEVVESYEALYREKVELLDKINMLNNGIQNYKSMEKTMQKALMLAQKTADDTQETALRNAHVIEKEALAKADIIIKDAKNSLEQLHQKTILLAQQYEKYKLQFKNLAAAQIELLESESFQFHIMDLPNVLAKEQTTVAEEPEQPTPKKPTVSTQPTASPKSTQTPLSRIDINFTNASSENYD